MRPPMSQWRERVVDPEMSSNGPGHKRIDSCGAATSAAVTYAAQRQRRDEVPVGEQVEEEVTPP